SCARISRHSISSSSTVGKYERDENLMLYPALRNSSAVASCRLPAGIPSLRTFSDMESFVHFVRQRQLHPDDHFLYTSAGSNTRSPSTLTSPVAGSTLRKKQLR